ncbi:MAG: CopG family transcriptional regulator [Allosphingosinicella sp.]|uniref:CopG family transcriptional regulator n=1 Tax=Allosphingosinicella sp. TaxID=2823234 RepID=UPI0039603517
MRKDRLNVYFSAGLTAELAALAARRKVTKSAIVEAAVASYLSPDGADRREAAFVRRLDRLSRQVERLERDVSISTEALALFVRFWLTTTPPLPDTMQAAAQAKGRERYEGFVETLGRRLAKGQSLAKEVVADVADAPDPDRLPDQGVG